MSDAAGDVIWSILDHLGEPPPPNWEALSTVFVMHNRAVTETYGFLYLPNGQVSNGAPAPHQVQPAVDAYMADLFGPTDVWPVKMLFQFDRASGAFSVDFEDTDESRWYTTWDRMGELKEDLRPNFEDEDDEVPAGGGGWRAMFRSSRRGR